jgi:hypothetical protein
MFRSEQAPRRVMHRNGATRLTMLSDVDGFQMTKHGQKGAQIVWLGQIRNCLRSRRQVARKAYAGCWS